MTHITVLYTAGYDSETRVFIIVTGNCSDVSGTHHTGAVLIDSTGMSVHCHFDEFGVCVFLGSGQKDL